MVGKWVAGVVGESRAEHRQVSHGSRRQLHVRQHRVTGCCVCPHVSCVCLQLLEGNKYLLHALGSGLWPVLVLLSEIVQTFILADFW